MTNPELARTLELIAAGGADAFYTGPLAREIVAAAAAAVNPRTGRGGLLSLADLAAYRAVRRQPVPPRRPGLPLAPPDRAPRDAACARRRQARPRHASISAVAFPDGKSRP